MKVIAQNFFTSIGMLVIPMSGFSAQIVDFSSCSISGSARTRCALDKSITLSKLPEEMDATYSVKYRFPCKGHQTGLMFDAGREKKPLIFTSADHLPNTMTVDGPEELRFFDYDQSATYRATLKGECFLTVESVAIAPSSLALADWTKDAGSQAKIIRLSSDRYELISDYKAYATWDSAQTQTILASSRLKLNLFESLCNGGDQTACRSAAHFRVLVGALEAKIAGSPVPPISDEGGDEIVAAYKKDLEAEVVIGEALVDRFKRWELAVSEELKSALESLQK